MYTLRPSERLVKLLSGGRNYKIPKGQIIQSTEDRRVFNYLKSGYVKRYLISNDGSYGVQVIYGPEDMFPITLAFSAVFDLNINDSPETYYYEAMTDVELFTIDEEALKDAIAKDPLLYKDLFGICGVRLHSTLHGLENLTLSNSYHRVAHEILFLANKYGKKKAAGTEIQVQLTHQDLADILSLTRETVSTAMVQLRKNKLISTGKNILVPDMTKLEEEAHD
jgi:CRP/FNR family transcriptional regulator